MADEKKPPQWEPPHSSAATTSFLLSGSLGVVMLVLSWIGTVQTVQSIGWTHGIPIGMTLCFIGLVVAYCQRERVFVAEHRQLIEQHENEVSRLKSEHPQLSIEFRDIRRGVH